MTKIPKPRTWILVPPRTFGDVENLAKGVAAKNGWAVEVEPVVVDGQNAALVVYSEIVGADEPILPEFTTGIGGSIEARTTEDVEERSQAAETEVASLPRNGVMLSEFERHLARTALDEYNSFGSLKESNQGLSDRIEQYWTDLERRFPGVDEAWSAMFVSWCLKQAGASEFEFKFSAQHSVFVQWAISNTKKNCGLFHAHSFNGYAPSVGDIIQNNRPGKTFNFSYAAAHSDYESHSAIVVDTGIDAKGRFATTIGGNEGDSIGRRRVSLDDNGLIVQRHREPFICVIQTLK